jgi:hypothetical protein
MPSDIIEGEPSHLRVNSIFSPSMPTLEVSCEPILDPDDPSYALSPKSHNDPRNPQTQPNHRSHENHMDNKQELLQWLEYIRNWLECIKNLDDIAKSYWKDKEEAL